MAEAPLCANAVQSAGSKRKRGHILGMLFVPASSVILDHCDPFHSPSVLDVVSDLERRLPSIKSDTVAAAALADTVRRRILQKDPSRFDDDGAARKAGVLLWNLVLRLERDAEKTTASTAPAEYRLLLLHSRVLAFVIIDKSTCQDTSVARGEEEKSARLQVLHLMSIAVRAAKACIGKSEISFSMW